MAELYNKVRAFAKKISSQEVTEELDLSRAAYVEALRREFPAGGYKIGHDASNKDCVIVIDTESGEEVIVKILVGEAVK